MKLWVLGLAEGEGGWDCAYGFVVRAKDEAHARKLASEQAGDEGADAWLLPSRSTCEELTTRGEQEVILRSFVAG